jgi:hypothetical protein
MKATKAEARFEHPASMGNHCGDCIFFQPETSSCSKVQGVIMPQDWCKFFKRGTVKRKETNALNELGFNEKQKAAGTVVPKPKPRVSHPDRNQDCMGACNEAKKPNYMNEHDKIKSRTNGKSYEISMGPQPGQMVPKNPFASLAQEGFLHAHPEKLGAKKLAEFDKATKGKKLPYKVNKRGAK